VITRIHVNQHIIKRNRATGERDPVLTVKNHRGNFYAHAVEILGPSRIAYSSDRPLPCGATVWVETEAEVRITDPGPNLPLDTSNQSR
jgi:hypothetical protein